jgi:hypothetical protein
MRRRHHSYQHKQLGTADGTYFGCARVWHADKAVTGRSTAVNPAAEREEVPLGAREAGVVPQTALHYSATHASPFAGA